MKPSRTSSTRPARRPRHRPAAAALVTAWTLIFGAWAAGSAHAAGCAVADVPAVAVTGSGEVSAAPDRAVVSLGAVVEAKQAVDAQRQMAQVMQRVLKDVKALGIPDKLIRTTGLSLSPVYTHPGSKAGLDPEAPRISGYRAANTVQIQLDDLERLGSVIDAGIGAGANQMAGLSFELKDDTALRRQALQIASQEARLKAEAIASALNLQLGEVLDVREQGAPTPYPVERRFAAPAAAGATPVQPGQVQVSAGVTIRFKLTSAKP